MIANKSLLIDVANLISPSGYETQFIDFVNTFCKTHCSNLKVIHSSGSLFIVYLSNPSAKTILYDAHIDQVSCRVFKITDDGFLCVRCFGTNPEDLVGKPVKVLTIRGDIIPGIITIHPPHLNINQSDNIIIDIFMNSDKQASKYVSIGDAIVFDSPAKIVNTDYLVGAGLDNHVGAYCLLETAKYLSNNAKKLNLKYNVVFHLSRREEISGLKFVEIFRNEPNCPKSIDIVIVVDTDIATDIPSIDPNKFPLVQLSKGPILTRNIIDDDKVYRYIRSIAGKIPYQVSMSEGDGGNNLTDYAKLMIYGQFVGIPLRYMHSSVETCFLPDIEKTIDLLIAIYSNLDTFFSSK